jgi:hypothetical protein
MSRIERTLSQMQWSPNNVRFSDLRAVCNYYFGAPRQKGTSHCVYRMPWIGDPRINIQAHDGMAKSYQIKQVLAAIAKLENTDDSET